jgi:hypothetical protein
MNQTMNELIIDVGHHKPLRDLIGEFVESYSTFFAHPISRCVGFQFYQPHIPGLFLIFKRDNQNNLEWQSITRHANLYQKRNAALSRQKSELMAEIALKSSQSLFMMAHQINNPDHHQELVAELKDLLYAYLDPHIGDRFLNKI